MLILPNLDNNTFGVITIRFNNTDFLWVCAIVSKSIHFCHVFYGNDRESNGRFIGISVALRKNVNTS